MVIWNRVTERVLQISRGLRRNSEPPAAKVEARKDALGLPEWDPGIERTNAESIAWLSRAQDCSTSADGGFARHYSLIDGWSTSYPETTGYIVPTLLDYAHVKKAAEVRMRAKKALDWLSAIQLPEGGFQGGRIESRPVMPVTFNTGQILLGLAAGYRAFSAYGEAMTRAADWLAATQDPDGCWRRFPTPFAKPGEKAYETHVSWGLFEAERNMPGRGYGEAGLRQVRWALGCQRENGWIEKCCLTDPQEPLTHTLGYALRGIVEAYRLSQEKIFLDAAKRTADGLLSALGSNGFLPGRLASNWRGTVSWACLTGTVQVAHSWLLLYGCTGDVRYRDGGFLANRYVRRTMSVDGPPEVRGGIKGSFPIDGDYGCCEYLSWAVKFAVDSNLLEQAIRGRERRDDW